MRQKIIIGSCIGIACAIILIVVAIVVTLPKKCEIPDKLIDGKCMRCASPNKWVDDTCKTCPSPNKWVGTECQSSIDDDNNCLATQEPVSGVCVEKCMPNWSRDATGTCVKLIECRSGEQFSNGECVPKCNFGEVLDGGKCVEKICDPGSTLGADGSCVKTCGTNEELLEGECQKINCGFGYEPRQGECRLKTLAVVERVPETGGSIPSSGVATIMFNQLTKLDKGNITILIDGESETVSAQNTTNLRVEFTETKFKFIPNKSDEGKNIQLTIPSGFIENQTETIVWQFSVAKFLIKLHPPPQANINYSNTVSGTFEYFGIDEEISAEFDREIQLNYGSITLKDGMGQTVQSWSISYDTETPDGIMLDKNKLIIAPGAPLTEQTAYTVTVDKTCIQGKDGTLMTEVVEWSWGTNALPSFDEGSCFLECG